MIDRFDVRAIMDYLPPSPPSSSASSSSDRPSASTTRYDFMCPIDVWKTSTYFCRSPFLPPVTRVGL